MPTYAIQAPDGQTYQIDGPAGASDDQVRAQVLRQHPTAGAKPDVMSDVAKSGVTGLKRTMTGLADQVASSVPGLSQIHQIASGMWDVAHHQTPSPGGGNLFSDIGSTVIPDHKPQTWQGRTAMTAGEMIPAAFGGEGSLAARAANVIVPTVVSSVAGEAAKALHASPKVEEGVRMAGAVAGGVGAAVRANPAALAAKAPKVSLDTLETAKNAAYKAVDDSGVKFTPKAFDTLTQDMAKSMDEQGFNAGLHPKAAAMVEKIGQAQKQTGGHSPTLTQLDQLRQQIGRDVAASSDAGDRRMGQIMRESIDNFVNSATAEHLAEGAPEGAAQLITKARDLNTRVAKLRSLDNLDEAAADRAAATGSGGNGENTLRQNVIRFQNKTKNLTSDEEAAAQTAIRGTGVGNMFRLAGKLSPEGNGLMLGGHIGAAALTHGSTVPVALAGAASKIISKAMTQRNVNALRDLIANGGSKAQIAAAQKAVLKSQPPLLRLQSPLASDQSANVFRTASGVEAR